MKIKNFEVPNILKWVVLISLPVVFLVATYSSFNNTDVDYRTTFTMETKKRTAFFDKMWKKISGKSQIAVKYDSSFIRIVQTAMDPRKDGANIMMKWVTESNPTMQASTVQELYVELGRTIDSEREGFYEREEMLASIEQQHTKFLLSFPNNFWNIFMGRKPVEYSPITSSRTEEVMRTGKDDSISVF
jgi:hypothetical protein